MAFLNFKFIITYYNICCLFTATSSCLQNLKPACCCCRYEAGDHVAVYPVNDVDSVNAIGKRLNLDLDTVITLTNVDGNSSALKFFLLLK